MLTPGTTKTKIRSASLRPRMECLEGRVLPTGVNWLNGFGIGVTGQNSTIRSNAVATDSSGDTFITGSFRGTAQFNPLSPGSTVSTANTQDTFVAKYSPTGGLDWVKTFAGTTTTSGSLTTTAVSQGSAIAVDGSGNVFVAGGFSGTVDLSGTSGITAITSPTSTTEIDLVKLDPNGNLTWVDTVAGTQYDTDQAFALALDGAGGVVMAGSFSDSATFGSTTLTAGGSSDAFVSRVNSSGQFVWSVASQGQNGSNAQVDGVAVDASGNVDLAGFFSGTIDADPGSSSSLLTSSGSNDALIWKLNSSGSFVWAKSFGSIDYDAASAIAVDSQGNIYATGAFSDTVSFGSTSLTAGPIYDTFVVKLSPTGTVAWADGLVGPGGWSKGLGIAIDPAGDVNLGGTFQGLIDFNPGSSTNNLTSVGYTDVFAEGLDPNGNFVYAIQDGTTNFNATLGVSVNASGLVAATGTYSSSISFGSTTIPAIGLASAFVATLNSPGSVTASPSSPILDPSSDTGLSQTDGITSATSPLFDINSATAGNTVELLRNGVIVGSRTGPGTIRDPGPLSQGTYTYTSVQVSPNGFASQPTTGTLVTVLTIPPPATPAPILDPVDDSGTIGDGITNVRQPRIQVSASANTTVQLLNSSGTVLVSTFTSTASVVTLTLPQPLADGTYPIVARAVDLAGNLSTNSPGFSLTILATPPPSPTIPAILPADVTGPTGSNLTSVRQPRFTGSAASGTTVEILTTSGTLLASTTVAGGSYSAKISSPLSDGTYTVDALAIDAASNRSVLSGTTSFTIDGTPPASPTGLTLLTVDDSGTVGDGITNVRQPRLTGTAEPNSTIQIVDASNQVEATAVTGSNGTFTAMISSPLADGTYVLQARATDPAGNVGPLSLAFRLTILGTAPAAPSAPSLFAADDSGPPNATNVNQPRLIGTAQPNTTVQILGPTGVVYATVGSGSSGSYMVQVTSVLADGTYSLHAISTDVAGNTSPAGSNFSLTIITTRPAAPSAPTLLPADDSGTVGDRITNVRQPRLTGTATPNLMIRLLNSANAVIGSTTATSNGQVTVAPATPLAEGTYILHFVAVDAVGNQSPAGGSISLTILGTTPSRLNPPVLLAADVAVGSTGALTPLDHPVVTGTANPGDLVSWITPGGSVLATATASPSTGSYQLVPTNALVNGSYSVEVTQTDAAGNVSPLSNPFNLTVRVDPGDYFGNGRTAIGVYGNLDNTFNIQNPINGTLYSKWFGMAGDIPVNGDFFGNGHADIAIYRPSTSTFYVTDPVTGAGEVVQLGQPGAIPVPADYDGDGKTDFAVFQPSNFTFYILKSATNTLVTKPFGVSTDLPVPADYFGNGHADIAIYRPSTSTFYVADPITGAGAVVTIGLPGSIPIPADYEGIGRADYAVYETGISTFVAKFSTSSTPYTLHYGTSGDIPVIGDYYYDGLADLAVFRPSTATFYAYEITTGRFFGYQWGAAPQVKPDLAPITTWLNVVGIGKTSAIASAQINQNGLDLLPIPIEIAPIEPAQTIATTHPKTSTVDLAIEALSLERWRP